MAPAYDTPGPSRLRPARPGPLDPRRPCPRPPRPRRRGSRPCRAGAPARGHNARVTAEPEGIRSAPAEAAPAPLAAPQDGAARQSLLRRLAPPAAALGAVLAAFAYVGAVDPNEPGHYPACPLLRFTGLYCPGCGGLRSAHAFIHGDLSGALGDNALAVLGYGAAALLWTVWVLRAARGLPGPRTTLPTRGLWALGAVVLVFSVVRNLPLGSFLHP